MSKPRPAKLTMVPGLEKPPTQPQTDWALELVRRLRESNNIKADHYAQSVVGCNNRLEMASVIREMLDILKEIEGADTHG